MALSADALRCLKFALGRKGVSDEIAAILNGTVTVSQTFSGGATFNTTGITITDVDVALSATTGTKIGTATTQKLGFFNATPVVQRSAFTQTYSTADRTVANITSTAHTYPGSGNMFDAAAADLLINIRTDSTANAVADTVVNIKSLADNLNQCIADVTDAKQAINSIIDDLQALGLAA